MGGVTPRDFAGEDDYERMRSLLRSACAESGPDVLMTLGDLDYWRYQSADPDAEMRSCRLWLDDRENALGFAWPGLDENDAGVIDVFAHPRHVDLLEPMLAWGEAWHAKRGTTGVITVNGHEADPWATAVLTERGYERSESFSHWYRVRRMDAKRPEPRRIDGYALRAAEPARDAPAVAETNNRSGAGPRLTETSCRAIMHAPTYRRDLHVLAEPVSGDPSIVAAFCIAWYDEANRIGLFEPVACDPAHQRRGLGAAVMTEGLRRLRSLGATHALVACAGGNEAANGLYRSLNFAPRGTSREWTKTITGEETKKAPA